MCWTMISDKQRREVARKLRALDMSDIDVDGCIIDSSKYVCLLLMRMLDVACDYRDGLHYFPGHFSAQAVVELFADLIDRPTCHDVGGGYEFRCSACGCVIHIFRDGGFGEDDSAMTVGGDSLYAPHYCPNCGAEVVE